MKMLIEEATRIALNIVQDIESNNLILREKLTRTEWKYIENTIRSHLEREFRRYEKKF